MQALIAIGSNLNPTANIREALKALGQGVDCRLIALSRFFLMPALNNQGQPTGAAPYINGVAVLESDRDPTALTSLLKGIEDALGRERADAKSVVAIDLDLVMIRHTTAVAAEPTVLRPSDLHKPYFLIPAADVAGNWTLPGTQRTLAALAQTSDTQELELVQL